MRLYQLIQLTFASLKGQNLGFPLRPYLSKYAPFFKAVMACSRDHCHEPKSASFICPSQWIRIRKTIIQQLGVIQAWICWVQAYVGANSCNLRGYDEQVKQQKYKIKHKFVSSNNCIGIEYMKKALKHSKSRK